MVDADPDDGGWDFTLAAGASAHTAAASPENLYGATALGLWAARTSGCDSMRLFEGALDAGLGMQARPEVDSPPDFVFGIRLADLADNPGFATLARARYDAKLAANGGAAGLATLIRDFRHNNNADALIPYDLGWLVLGAAALDDALPAAGYHADADTYANIADAALASPYFDLDDETQPFYATGVAWAQVVAARVHDHSTLVHARARLLAAQQSDGSWEDDLDATAHALQTLALTNYHPPHVARRGAHWLVEAQATSGAWIDPANIETPQVEGEILLGLVLSRPELGDETFAPAAPRAPHPELAHASALPAL